MKHKRISHEVTDIVRGSLRRVLEEHGLSTEEFGVKFFESTDHVLFVVDDQFHPLMERNDDGEEAIALFEKVDDATRVATEHLGSAVIVQYGTALQLARSVGEMLVVHFADGALGLLDPKDVFALPDVRKPNRDDLPF